MAVVATCATGIVWGLGMDHTPWVYTGGYGGGLFKGENKLVYYFMGQLLREIIRLSFMYIILL